MPKWMSAPLPMLWPLVPAARTSASECAWGEEVTDVYVAKAELRAAMTRHPTDAIWWQKSLPNALEGGAAGRSSHAPPGHRMPLQVQDQGEREMREGTGTLPTLDPSVRGSRGRFPLLHWGREGQTFAT